MTERKEMSHTAILFWTMVFPSLALLLAFGVGVVVLVMTVGENYHSPPEPPTTCH